MTPTSSTSVDAHGDTALPLLFYMGTSGTVGDRKPIAILSVFAASVTPAGLPPITLAYFEGYASQLRFLPRLATHVIGPNWKEKLIVLEFSTSDALYEYVESHRKEFFHVTTGEFSFGASKGEMLCGFGDTLGNQWKTALLQDKRATKDDLSYSSFVLGPVFLPSLGPSRFFSDSLIIDKLKQFRQSNRSRKIIAMAGSLRVPFFVSEIVGWLQTQPQGDEDFAFILINYSEDASAFPPKYYTNPWRPVFNSDSENIKKGNDKPWLDEQIRLTEYIATHPHLILKLAKDEYVEFEDLLQFVDCVVTNCGAGSITVAMAMGCPQYCRVAGNRTGVTGNDKTKNDFIVRKELQLGPDVGRAISRAHWEAPPILEDLLLDFAQKWNTYQKNANVVQDIIREEYRIMRRIAEDLFRQLQSERSFQMFLDSNYGIVPDIYQNTVAENWVKKQGFLR